MNVHQRTLRLFSIAFFAALLGGPFIVWALPPTFEASNDLIVYSLLGWLLVLSVLLHLRIFCGFSGEGLERVWQPMIITHLFFIVPGLFGWLIFTLFGDDLRYSNAITWYYVLWGIGSLVASFWLPRTRPFAVLKIVGNHSRDFAVTGLIFFPVILGVVTAVIGLAASGI